MKMTDRIIVDRAPSVVFPLWAALERTPEFAGTTFERTKITDGPIGLGTKYQAVDHWPGRTVRFTVEYIEFEPDSTISARFSEPMAGGWQARFEPIDGGSTRVTMDMELRPSGLMGLLSPLMRPWAARQSKGFMAAFKAWAEAQPSSAPGVSAS